MQVTMALGAGTMAKHGAIITHTTSLQEIASMKVAGEERASDSEEGAAREPAKEPARARQSELWTSGRVVHFRATDDVT